MVRYLFLFQPSASHVTSSLPIAAELVARGAEVVYCVPEEFVAWIDAIGAKSRVICVPERYPPAQWENPQTPPLHLLYVYSVRQSAVVLPQVVRLLRGERLDYIVYDGMCLWARLVAELLQIPAITVRTSFAATIRHNVFRPAVGQGAHLALPDREEMMESIGDLSASIRREYGLRMPGSWSIFTHAGKLNIILVPRSLQPFADGFDDRFVFVGPYFVGPRPVIPAGGTAISVDRSTDVPVLYVSFGTSELNGNIHLYRVCLEALSRIPVRVIMSYGANIDVKALGVIPDNFQVAARVSQFTLLSQVDVFVSHGGFGSAMESMYHGVPMIMVPMMEEQEIVARIVTTRGAAVTLNPTVFTPDRLHEAISRVLSDSVFRSRAAELQRIIAACGGYRQAVDVILQRQGQL